MSGPLSRRRLESRIQTNLFPLCLVILSFFSLLPHGSFGHFTSPSTASITIQSVDSGAARVSLLTPGSTVPKVECVFTYRTGAETSSALKRKEDERKAAEEEAKKKATGGGIDLSAVVRGMEGMCITSTSNYWSYELCFGRYLKQFHGGDVYMLGRTQHVQPTNMLLEGGDMCAALNPPQPRKVNVRFACREGATTPLLTSISESSTCVYDIEVSTARVCGDARFPLVSGSLPSSMSGSAPAEPLDLGSEDWFIEIVELESAIEPQDMQQRDAVITSAISSPSVSSSSSATRSSVYMCTAYSLEYRATTVRSLHFESFDLRITPLQTAAPSQHRKTIEDLPAAYRTYTARQLARIDVPPRAIKVAYGNIARDETSDEEYDGTLSYLKVYA